MLFLALWLSSLAAAHAVVPDLKGSADGRLNAVSWLHAVAAEGSILASNESSDPSDERDRVGGGGEAVLPAFSHDVRHSAHRDWLVAASARSNGAATAHFQARAPPLV
jgi:hypothetical protein